jgi:oligopeptide/dipeptide ABC transporter ATP-binding protein
MSTPAPLLDVQNLSHSFTLPQSWLDRARRRPPRRVQAVDSLSLRVPARHTLALVGESGSGKSTAGRCLLRLIEPEQGSVRFGGADVIAADPTAMRGLRQRMQIVFQDPYSSLNPRQTVGAMLAEVLAFHRIGAGPAERRERARELLVQVGLRPDQTGRYPHEFSGGQRQRIGIARALAVEPEFIVCDEPVSALDVSVQAQIINLLEDLQSARGLAYLFIAHDLGVVHHIADEVAVMYLGRIVEQAPTNELFARPHHPYTRALLAAIPQTDPARRRGHDIVRGEPGPPVAGGCPFRSRCPLAMARCADDPPIREVAPGHLSRCWLD